MQQLTSHMCTQKNPLQLLFLGGPSECMHSCMHTPVHLLPSVPSLQQTGAHGSASVHPSTPPQLCAQEQAVWWSLYLRFIFLSKLSSCCSVLLAYIPGLAREATEKHFCERSEKPLQPEETFGNNLKYHNPHPQQKKKPLHCENEIKPL